MNKDDDRIIKSVEELEFLSKGKHINEETIDDLIERVTEAESFVSPKKKFELKANEYDIQKIAEERAFLDAMYQIIVNYSSNSKASNKTKNLVINIKEKNTKLNDSIEKDLKDRLKGRRAISKIAMQCGGAIQFYKQVFRYSDLRRKNIQENVRRAILTYANKYVTNQSFPIENISTIIQEKDVEQAMHETRYRATESIKRDLGLGGEYSKIDEEKESIKLSLINRYNFVAEKLQSSKEVQELVDRYIQLELYYRQLQKVKKNISNKIRNNRLSEKLNKQVQITIDSVSEECNKIVNQIRYLIGEREETNETEKPTFEKGDIQIRNTNFKTGQDFLVKVNVDSNEAIEQMRAEEEKELLTYSMFPENATFDNDEGKKTFNKVSEAVDLCYELVMHKDEITEKDIENTISELYNIYVMRGWYAEPELSNGILEIPKEVKDILRPTILHAIDQAKKLKNGEITSEILREKYAEKIRQNKSTGEKL